MEKHLCINSSVAAGNFYLKPKGFPFQAKLQRILKEETAQKKITALFDLDSVYFTSGSESLSQIDETVSAIIAPYLAESVKEGKTQNYHYVWQKEAEELYLLYKKIVSVKQKELAAESE